MKQPIFVPLILRIFLGLVLNIPALAEKQDGAEIFQRTCATCHGKNGEGNGVLNSPPIAGLPRWYVLLQLQRYRDGLRGAHPDDPTGNQMAAIAKTLELATIPALATHISALEPEKALPPPSGDANSARGKTLYLEHCAACHRFNASGEQVFRSPPLRGFPTWYLQNQYEKFVNGQRGTIAEDEDGKKMRDIAASEIPEADLRDILVFIADLVTEK